MSDLPEIVIPPEMAAALEDTARYMREQADARAAALTASLDLDGDFPMRCDYCKENVPHSTLHHNEHGRHVCIDAAACDAREEANAAEEMDA